MIDALVALRLQMDWGADEAIGHVPIDRLLGPPDAGVRLQPLPAPVPAQPRRADALAPAAPPQAATLDELTAELAGFEGCALRATATSTVRPEGQLGASLVVIGDAPGSEDDRSGRAFSGETGQRLRRVLASAGWGAEDLLLTTLVPWRPPGNRPVSEAEVAACLPFLHRLLTLSRPRLLLLLGAAPVRALTRETDSIRRLRGRTLQVQIPEQDQPIDAAALQPVEQWFRSAAVKQELWTDVLKFRRMATTG